MFGLTSCAKRSNGRGCWEVLPIFSLGSYDLSEKAMGYDRKWLFALAIIGIPGAHGLHGYVGFVFGSLKSREWWSSDLMPVIFLFSAIISGTALVIVLYVLSCKLRKVQIDISCLKVMAYALWGFMMFTLLLEGVEFASLVYRGREGIDVIMEFVKGPLVVPFFILQFGIGSLLPLAVITFLIWRGSSGTALIVGITGSAILVLLAVLMMRYNVVIWRAGNLEDRERLGGLSAHDFWQGGLAGGGNGIGHSDDLVIGDGPTVAAMGGGRCLSAVASIRRLNYCADARRDCLRDCNVFDGCTQSRAECGLSGGKPRERNDFIPSTSLSKADSSALFSLISKGTEHGLIETLIRIKMT